MNKIVDSLPGRPKFRRDEIVVAGESFDVYYRDILECVKALFGDAELSPHLIFRPERHYADEDKTIRMYGDMHSGKWWWSTQVSCFIYASLFTRLNVTLKLTEGSRDDESRRYNHPHHNFVR